MKHVSFATTDALLMSDIIPTDWKYHTIYNYLKQGDLRQIKVECSGIPCMANRDKLADMPELETGLTWGYPLVFTITGESLPDYGKPELEEVRVSVASYPPDEACADLLLDAVSTGEWQWWYENDGTITPTTEIFNK